MAETEIGTERTWDAASTPAASDVARRFELAWHAAPRTARPDPIDFLPENPSLRPGVLLALLRAEMGLRYEAGESPRVESFLKRHADLDHDALVALVYEEYCLREEFDGRPPDPTELDTRFPDLAESLHRVLDIHSLVGPCPSTATHLPGVKETGPKFPEAGQTIGGFHLNAEIGRGAFARVFRAEERQLADRPVALKVSRTGSREPQALARLQHTHIVPVHSYRTDPVTGLHLLCMPFLGDLTLAHVLADPTARDARHGAALVDALERLQPRDDRWGKPTGRLELARRGHAEAMAWWGARMAEALQHAHDRGVLHRDVKPSNVLITPDGLPMLLDFNLAQEPLSADSDSEEAEGLGGTLAYMAPEQLRALAEGRPEGIDGRSDIYALGVLLYEAVTGGTRPFTNPRDALTVRQALQRMLDERLAGPPRLRDDFPEVPHACEAVLRKCLSPRPGDRYQAAADLARDLQAVADHAPLHFAREPLVSRATRWVRRRRAAIVFVTPILTAVVCVALSVARDARERERAREDRLREVQRWMNRADVSYQNGQADLAIEQLTAAIRLANADSPSAADPMLRDLAFHAKGQRAAIEQEEDIHSKADVLFREIEPLYARLLDPTTHAGQDAQALEDALAPFYVFRNPAWADLEDLVSLDAREEGRRARLIDEIDGLLFLWAIELDRDAARDPAMGERVLDLARRGRDSGPWRALKARWGGDPATVATADRPAEETSPRVCLQWALLRDLQGEHDRAIAWLRRATDLDPGEFWPQWVLASWLERDGQHGEASAHAEAAMALRPRSARARELRDRLAPVDRATP